MSDSLADDQLKLVAYTIVFAKPPNESVMPGGEGSMVVPDNLTEEQFVAMVIARYLKPKDAKPPDVGKVIKSPTDWKYLKVYYAVPHRWKREPLDAGSRQDAALEQLCERLAKPKGC